MLILNRLMMLPGLMVQQGVRFKSFIQVAAVYEVNSAISIPADTQVGDLVILHMYAKNTTGTPIDRTPTGFTKIITTGAAPDRGSSFFKIAAPGDAGAAVSGGLSGTSYSVAFIVVLRGDVPVQSAALKGPVGDMDVNKPATQSILASAGKVPLLALGIYHARSTFISNPTMTVGGSDVADGTYQESERATKWKLYTSSPSDVAIAMNDSGNLNILHGCYLELG